jgi:hypothetical protein
VFFVLRSVLCRTTDKNGQVFFSQASKQTKAIDELDPTTVSADRLNPRISSCSMARGSKHGLGMLLAAESKRASQRCFPCFDVQTKPWISLDFWGNVGEVGLCGATVIGPAAAGQVWAWQCLGKLRGIWARILWLQGAPLPGKNAKMERIQKRQELLVAAHPRTNGLQPWLSLAAVTASSVKTAAFGNSLVSEPTSSAAQGSQARLSGPREPSPSGAALDSRRDLMFCCTTSTVLETVKLSP